MIQLNEIVYIWRNIEDPAAYRKGDTVAHEGDAIDDAILYEQDHRTDRSIYRDLYGMEYSQVLEICMHTVYSDNTSCQKLIKYTDAQGDDGELFVVLNTHATMIARETSFPSHLATAFGNLIREVEEHSLQKPNEDPNTPIDMAYYKFWRLLKEIREH